MNNLKNDVYFIKKALKEIDIIEEYSKNKTYDDLLVDRQYNDAIMFRLVQMVENIKNISSSVKDKHPDIPWAR